MYREVPALQGGGGGLGEKEMMILLQQRKIAALDEANNRLVGTHFSPPDPHPHLLYLADTRALQAWGEGDNGW